MADSRFSFKEFCESCEKIQSFSKFSDKENVLLQLIKKYKTVEQTIKQENSNVETSFYPVIRLLVPEYERERSPYGLKETSFSKLYVRTLCLKGSDANNLLKYNRISSNSKNSSDFADVAFWELRKWCAVSSNLTIVDVNAHLDRMANYHADHLPREVEKELRNMIKRSTATEQKWIIRIILKNMRLGLGNDRILKVFHPDAPDLFDVSSSLSKICTVLKHPNIRLHELEVEIFTPFRPMLSLQCDSAVLNQTLKGDKTFYVENKYDGERFQMHMKDGVFKYFSKNGYEYSSVYGETYDSQGLLTPYLAKMFSKVSSLILDGEMMGWNTKTNKFGSKGMSYDVKKLNIDSVHRPCYCVFDILLYNGKIMTNIPLSERLLLLDSLFDPIEAVILKSPRLEVKTKQEMMDELNKSMDRQEEGICFKDPESIYKPNNRKAGWWKLKLEYFDGLLTELDVLIIGGYYGEGKRKGLVSSFLLGVAEPSESSDASPSKFHSFAKVASGFTVEELDTLLNKLNPYWEPFEKNKNPENIVWKREKPDCWITPRKSCILQIKASELARTSDFQTDYTLRFPRVDKIRYDKPWYNCLTLAELKELTKSNQAVEKLNSRHITEGDIEVSPSKRARQTKDLSGSLYHLLDVQQKTNFLADKEFCVFTGTDELSKENIEVKIKECGGKVVQYTGPNTMCTLIGNLTPKAKSLISDATSDIVKLDWLIRLLENQSAKFLELTPDDMIVASKKTKMMFSNRYDKYGDSYFVPVTKESLCTAMKSITTQGDYLHLMPSEFMNFDTELSFSNPLGIFRPCFAYFSKYSINNSNRNASFYLAERDFVFYGGTKCDCIKDYTTHVIVDSRDVSVVKKIKQEIEDREDIKIINEHWIEQCLILKELVSEENFIVNFNL